MGGFSWAVRRRFKSRYGRLDLASAGRVARCSSWGGFGLCWRGPGGVAAQPNPSGCCLMALPNVAGSPDISGEVMHIG